MYSLIVHAMTQFCGISSVSRIFWWMFNLLIFKFFILLRYIKFLTNEKGRNSTKMKIHLNFPNFFFFFFTLYSLSCPEDVFILLNDNFSRVSLEQTFLKVVSLSCSLCLHNWLVALTLVFWPTPNTHKIGAQ